MDLSNTELHVIGFISTAQDTLDRAKSLIRLAEKNQDEAATLCACATILLSAALEQAVRTKLSEAAEIIAFEENKDYFETGPARYLDPKVKASTRVRSLPRVLTNNRYQLNPKHEITKILEELIQTRNTLVHVDEPAAHMIGPNDRVKIENNKITAVYPFEPNPWGMVSLKKAKALKIAVEVYFTEVLFPASGEITEGTIVISTKIPTR
jgi:hypothetical protein